MGIKPGDQVFAITSSGMSLPRRAVSGIEETGHAFPIIWICRDDEYESALQEGRSPSGTAWPADAIRLATGEALTPLATGTEAARSGS
jgi:hypothetical protein